MYQCDTCGDYDELTSPCSERNKWVGKMCMTNLECKGHMRRVILPTTFKLGTNGKAGWASTGYADNLIGNDPDWRKANGVK